VRGEVGEIGSEEGGDEGQTGRELRGNLDKVQFIQGKKRGKTYLIEVRKKTAASSGRKTFQK